MECSYYYTAEFSSVTNEYLITIPEGLTITDGDGNTVESGSDIPYGTVLTVTADPMEGYTPVITPAVGENGEFVFSGETEFTVTYEINQYTISLDLDGGSFAAAPSGWTKESDGSYTKKFDYDTSYAAIIADIGTPEKTGYVFDGYDPSTGNLGINGATITAQYSESKSASSDIFSFDRIAPAPIFGLLFLIIPIAAYMIYKASG